jgi:hypothetical protein
MVTGPAAPVKPNLHIYRSTHIAIAGAWPNCAIKLVVPFPPGGAADTVARVYADKLTEALKQPVMIENKASAGTAIAAEAVASADPDGCTLSVFSPANTNSIGSSSSICRLRFSRILRRRGSTGPGFIVSDERNSLLEYASLVVAPNSSRRSRRFGGGKRGSRRGRLA